ncbi:MAG TPA: hypothetical protein VFV34_15725 [Blastocatellia bacterium]|nr:hypothetical protein [Blastocatellia bacterium]
MAELPTFLDFEASSLSDRSYPIEVAWNLSDGTVEAHLISPASIEAWTDWSAEAEMVHGIARTRLLAHGESPHSVCDRMNGELGGRIVYTDAPSFDGMWLAAMFDACRRPVQFELRHIDDLLVKMVCPELPGRTYGLLKIDLLKQEARRLKPRQHRAAWDVEYLIQLWRLASFDAGHQ